MNRREIRMRCIEAISHSGIREPNRITKDAERLEEWVLAVEDDKAEAPTSKATFSKVADKEPTPA